MNMQVVTMLTVSCLTYIINRSQLLSAKNTSSQIYRVSFGTADIILYTKTCRLGKITFKI